MFNRLFTKINLPTTEISSTTTDKRTLCNFNIMYFSRCINYLDYKRCNYEIKIEEYYKYLEKIIKKNNAVFGFSQVVKTDIYNNFALENEKYLLEILKCYKPIIFQGLTQVRNISYYTESLNFYLYLKQEV